MGPSLEIARKRMSSRARSRSYRERNPEKRLASNRAWRARNRKKDREYTFARRGIRITSEDYDALFSLQGGVCALCGESGGVRSLAVDHCHISGVVRGLLCTGCNLALGKLGDDEKGLFRALAYVRGEL